MKRDVFVTGGTGYLGRPLIEALLARGRGIDAHTESPDDRGVTFTGWLSMRTFSVVVPAGKGPMRRVQ